MSTIATHFRSDRFAAAMGGGLAVIALLIVAACRAEVQPEAPRQAVAADTGAVRQTLYVREFAFVGERDGTPLVVPFVFSAAERDAQLRRSARAWLAHGAEWDAFLQESWTGSALGGVWRILPTADLRVIAGGADGIESLLFRRGERVLRLAPELLRATWSPRDELQYRLYEGRLDLGGQPTHGSVVEAYRVQHGATEEGFGAGALDWLYATDGASVHLLLAESLGTSSDPDKTFAWVVLPDADQAWEQAQIRWMEMRPVEQARRDVPVAWSFSVPGSGIEGEVFSLGYQLQLGPDRPGRRAVLMRHSVEGWAGIGEDRYRIFGLLRHTQE
jgi:hypothetical protein